MNHTDKVTLAGLYLAKYNHKALNRLGCTGFLQAFNILGYSLGAKPAAIKNYRDEFDHVLRCFDPEHPRTGWNRPLKTRSQRLFALFSSLGFEEFTELVQGFILPYYKKEQIIARISQHPPAQNFAQRLMTGQAAEAYFRFNFKKISEFSDYNVEDVTPCGCGYDFYLHKTSGFYCVEVKGLGDRTGSLLMTDKEYDTASQMQDKYCLFVVRNFKKTPCHSLFFNPIQSDLRFIPHLQTTTSYCTYV